MKGMKVLVIDDEGLIRKSLARACQRRGHAVFDADNGVDGKRVWLEENPDLVFLDIVMPGLTGPQLLEQMKPLSIPVILMSAYTADFDTQKAQDLGASLFISKPFNNVFEVVGVAEGLQNGR